MFQFYIWYWFCNIHDIQSSCLHLGAFIVAFSFLETVHILLVIFASQYPSHSFPRDVNDMLLLFFQICVVLVVDFSIGRLGSMPVWLDLIDSPFVKYVD